MSMLAKVLAFWALWKFNWSVRWVNSLHVFLLVAEDLDHLLALHHLFDKAVEAAQVFLLGHKVPARTDRRLFGGERTTATMARVVRRVRGMLSTIMDTRTLTTVMVQLSSWGMLWLSIWRRVSTSLVYTDMMSPWAWVSKIPGWGGSACAGTSHCAGPAGPPG